MLLRKKLKKEVNAERHWCLASSVSFFSTMSWVVLAVVAKHMALQRLLESSDYCV